MNLFQWMTVPFFTFCFLWDILGWLRSAHHFTLRPIRAVVWLLTAITLAMPDLLQETAKILGIGRGTDALLYFLTFFFLMTSFLFYSRYVRLQRQITEIVRHLAIQEARRGDRPPS